MKNTETIINEYKKIAFSTPILKKDEEFKLIKEFKEFQNFTPTDPAGDVAGAAAQVEKVAQNAKTTIINSYLRTVLNLAEKYSRRTNLDILDLIQCGIVGIMNALNKFDLKQYKEVTKNTGSLFAYFTYRAILMEMQSFYRMNVRAVGVPDSVNMKLLKINEMYKNGELNNLNTPEDLAKYVTKKLNNLNKKDKPENQPADQPGGMKERDVKNLLTLFKAPVELDKEIAPENDEKHNHEYKDFLLETFVDQNDEPIYKNFDESEFLKNMIARLDQKERFIITKIYGIDCEKVKPGEVAAELGKSLSCVLSKVKFIQEKLKKMMNQEENFVLNR